MQEKDATDTFMLHVNAGDTPWTCSGRPDVGRTKELGSLLECRIDPINMLGTTVCQKNLKIGSLLECRRDPMNMLGKTVCQKILKIGSLLECRRDPTNMLGKTLC